MARSVSGIWYFLATLLAASGAGSVIAQQITGGGNLSRLPATFVGDLPCADCPGIRYQLNLLSDQSFFLRMTYKDRNRAVDDIGSWTISSDGHTLLLHGGREAPEQFSIRDADTLRKLDVEGREIQTSLNYDLKRTEPFQSFEPRLLMRGMYRYVADTGSFTECLTRRKMGVAQESANAALEAAYSKTRQQPGEPLLVHVEGRLVERPPVEGGGVQSMLVVERFINIWPGETCGVPFSRPPLEGTYWKLTRLGERAVVPGQRQREAHLVLESASHRLSGSTGCNRLVGSYRLDGQSLRVGQTATTRMACDANIAAVEQKFAKALDATRTWNIKGDHLELYDASGALAARFEARLIK